MAAERRDTGWLTRAKSAINGALPALPSLDFAEDVDIPVYLIHHGADPEDYEIIFDFDLFVAETHRGFLARPKLTLWSGRNDVQRTVFARRLREAFAEQFETVRRELAAERTSRWRLPTIWDIGGFVFSGASSLLGTVFLMLATSAGRKAIEDVRAFLADSVVGRSFRSKPARVKLEETIREKQATIDEGLTRMEIKLHRDLWVHAHRGGPPGSMEGMDFGAWPLPGFVRIRMEA